MNLHVIDTGFFKLDGGAMFGVVPKSIWSKTNPADENNLCTWAMRCLLIEDGNRLILIDNGIGTKQDPKFLKHYYLHGDASLTSSLKKAGFAPEDITDMFLTHLHFDHCGGGVSFSKDGTGFELTFPNAQYWTNSAHWKWATEPNSREKASFLTENLLPMQQSGHLKFINQGDENPFTQFDLLYVDGHTEQQMLPLIKYKDKTIAFMGDLLPSASHIPIPYVMGYDVRPLLTMDEKISFLNQAADNNYILFFEHDPVNECATVHHTDKGVRVNDLVKLADVL